MTATHQRPSTTGGVPISPAQGKPPWSKETKIVFAVLASIVSIMLFGALFATFNDDTDHEAVARENTRVMAAAVLEARFHDTARDELGELKSLETKWVGDVMWYKVKYALPNGPKACQGKVLIGTDGKSFGVGSMPEPAELEDVGKEGKEYCFSTEKMLHGLPLPALPADQAAPAG